MGLELWFMIVLGAAAIIPIIAVLATLGYGLVSDPTRLRKRRGTHALKHSLPRFTQSMAVRGGKMKQKQI